MNKFGFWGDVTSMSHLQFQNGYHQYEVLEYLHVDNVPWSCAADMVAGLADQKDTLPPIREVEVATTMTQYSSLQVRKIPQRAIFISLHEPQKVYSTNRILMEVFVSLGLFAHVL